MFNTDYETLFSIVGVLAFVGWGALAFSPLRPAFLILAARAVSVVLAIIYTTFLISLWGVEPEGNFSSLAGVAAGFSNMGNLLTGWIHFLALDLFIGAWQVEKGRKVGLPHLLLLPCLALTFLYGPLGLLLFLAMQSIKQRSVVVS